jgi:hypothetical protein
MSLWKWIHRQGNHATRQWYSATAVHRDFSAIGNAINPKWRSGWSRDESGIYETRRCVGQSTEGFHAGVEISYRIHDAVVWSEAHATPEKARQAAGEMERRRREETENFPEREQDQ